MSMAQLSLMRHAYNAIKAQQSVLHTLPSSIMSSAFEESEVPAKRMRMRHKGYYVHAKCTSVNKEACIN
jgi:hypothetical protein